MRPIMARLRGASVSSILLHGLPNIAAPPAAPELPPAPKGTYADAMLAAATVCRNLGLDIDYLAFDDAGDLLRFVYAQGWLASESRLAAADMADSIAQAIGDPGSILARNVDESIPHWSVRAVQHAVAYGAPQ